MTPNEGITVVCGQCRQPIDYNYKAVHERHCTSDDPSDIGLVEQDEDEELPSDRHGRTLGDKRTLPECDLCRRDILAIQYDEHLGECNRHDEPVDIAVAEDGVDPVCAVCDQAIEQEQFRDHVIACSRQNTDSDLGLSESGRINKE